MSRKLERITLTLPDSMAASIRARAAEDDRSISSVARQALRKYFDQQTLKSGQAAKCPR